VRIGLTGGVTVLVCLAAVAASQASIKIAGDAKKPTLRVARSGVAEVGWTTQAGARRFALVLRDGSVRYGARLGARDVSRPTHRVKLPFSVTVRETPDGRLWALQAWRRLRTGPFELMFSRWRGKPTRLTLSATCCKWRSETIQGRASFHGKPVHGFSATRDGVPLDPFGRNVYLDTYRSGKWQRMMGILARRPQGKFRLWIRPHWRGTIYRGTIRGPNRGWTLAPDAHAWAQSAR
jgi:hypothetical protein